MIPDLSFVIKFHCDEDMTEIRTWIRKKWSNLDIVWHEYDNRGQTSHNRIILKQNEYYDPHRINDDDGWFFYRYLILVSTRKNPEPTNEDYLHQLNFARLMIQHLQRKECQWSLQAEFNVKLE